MGCDVAVADQWIEPLQFAMAVHLINTPDRQAAFLAQTGHETGGLKWLTELWGPTEAQKAYELPNSKALSLGNIKPGDGFRYRGRGLIQITGRTNYSAVGIALCLDCINDPDLLAEPEWASQSAAWWWEGRGLNELADAGDFKEITKIINGGLNGYDDRVRRWNIAKQALGA
jgi:putative chitinase